MGLSTSILARCYLADNLKRWVIVPIRTGTFFALVIGFFGGLFPAMRAARTPVAHALREQCCTYQGCRKFALTTTCETTAPPRFPPLEKPRTTTATLCPVNSRATPQLCKVVTELKLTGRANRS